MRIGRSIFWQHHAYVRDLVHLHGKKLGVVPTRPPGRSDVRPIKIKLNTFQMEPDALDIDRYRLEMHGVCSATLEAARGLHCTGPARAQIKCKDVQCATRRRPDPRPKCLFMHIFGGSSPFVSQHLGLRSVLNRPHIGWLGGNPWCTRRRTRLPPIRRVPSS